MSRSKMAITNREQDILNLKTDSIKEISERLEISRSQVFNYIRTLKNKGLWPYNTESKVDNEPKLIIECLELINKLSPEALTYLKSRIK